MRQITGSALLAVCALALGSATVRGEDKKVNIEGTYILIGMEAVGKDLTDLITKSPEGDRTFKVSGDQIIVTKNGKDDPASYKIDTSKTPYQIDLTAKGAKGKEEKMYGIFKIDGDKLIICVVESDKAADRPKEFKTAADNKAMIMTLQKKKK